LGGREGARAAREGRREVCSVKKLEYRLWGGWVGGREGGKEGE
jgi:hypothetical protein